MPIADLAVAKAVVRTGSGRIGDAIAHGVIVGGRANDAAPEEQADNTGAR